MKSIFVSIVAAVVLVGCGEAQQSTTPAEAKLVEPVVEVAKPKPPTAKAPDISIGDAALFGNIEAIKQHIAAGADVNEKDEKGATPLHGAAFTGRMEVVELLIANGANVNAKDKDGGTPLLHATLSGHREIVELLISKGADVNAKVAPSDRLFKGKTPLDLASKAEISDLLRKHGGKTGEELKAILK